MKNASREMSKEQLVSDFKVVVADAEALLKATANHGGEKASELRAKTEESIKAMKAKLGEAEATVIEKTKAAAKQTDEYVHDNPWSSIGVAAGVGLVLGLLIGRR